MKPHEETWEHNFHSRYITLDQGNDEFHPVANFDSQDGADADAARAKLAAQAPAMARFIKAMREQYDWDVFPELDEEATPLLRDAGVIP